MALLVARSGRRLSGVTVSSVPVPDAYPAVIAAVTAGFRALAPLMRSMRHIAVDRAAPAAALLAARSALRAGEVVGVLPEAGISRSFTIRVLMPGAASLARWAQAPLIPMAIWGPQRLYTVGRRLSWHRGQAVRLLIGPPLPVRDALDVRGQTRALGRRLAELLEQDQVEHPDPPAAGEDAWWHPAHLGGAAPTLRQAGTAEGPIPTGAVAPLFGAGTGRP